MDGDRLPPPLSFTRSASSSKPAYQISDGISQKANGRRPPRVISLSAYCIRALSLVEIHNLPDIESFWTRRSYDSTSMKKAVVDLLPFIPRPLLGIPENKLQKKSLPGSTLDATGDVYVEPYIGTIHPQLWGLLNALIIPSTLPPILRHFSLSLVDEHVPSLQTSPILSTPTLSLLTHVSFSSTESRSQITDDSLLQLRTLACLTVLNLAATPIKSRGILRLLGSMRAMLPSKASPWRLRVLDLRRTFVDDDILFGNNSWPGLNTLPMLCAIDLRDTSVSSSACKTFQLTWGSSSPTPLELFHPTQERSLMDCISRLINDRNSAQATPTVNHAILLLDRPPPPKQQKDPSLGMNQDERGKKDQILRIHTSGVVVLTATKAILGNVLEVPCSGEEGSAQAAFKTNQATIASLYSGRGSDGEDSSDARLQSLEQYSEYDLEIPYYEDYQSEYSDGASQQDIDDETIYDEDSQGDLDSGEEPLRDLHEVVNDQLMEDIELGFIMYRDPPDPGVLSQLDVPPPTQGAKKRPRTNNETLSAKRFKGPVMSQIFGANAKSMSSRRL